MRTGTLLVITAVVVGPLLLSDCSKKQDQPQAQAPTAAPPAPKAASEPPARTDGLVPAAPAGTTDAGTKTPVYFGEVIAAWNAGNKEEAVKKFLEIRWTDPVVFGGIPILTMTEEQFAKLLPGQREQISQQAQELSKILRDIAKGVASAGGAAAAVTDPAGAKARLDAVHQFGQSLSGPDHLLIVQLVGKAIAQLTPEKLPAAQ
jgi:hypothetical protein